MREVRRVRRAHRRGPRGQGLDRRGTGRAGARGQVPAPAGRAARADPGAPGVEDTARRQHRAAELLQALRGQSFRTGAGELVGAEGRPSRKPDLWLFVTDVDLFTAQTDGTIAALSRRTGVAIVSIRRLREAFYRRPADPNRQRARLVKELLRMIGRLAGLKECPTPTCALAGTRGVPDIDVKQEMFCRPCAQAFFQGRISI